MPTNGASHSAGAIAKVNAVQRPFTFGHQSLGAAARKDVRGSCCDRLIPWEDWQMSPLVVRGHHWNSTVRIRRGDNDRGISSSSGVALRQRGYQHKFLAACVKHQRVVTQHHAIGTSSVLIELQLENDDQCKFKQIAM